jgi:hypothetical protein
LPRAPPENRVFDSTLRLPSHVGQPGDSNENQDNDNLLEWATPMRATAVGDAELAGRDSGE